MGQGMLHKLIEVLIDIAKSLKTECSCTEMEKTAIMIHRSMSYQARQFHTLDHVFGFLDSTDAIGSLAAVFHDLIYLQVDGGLPPDTQNILEPYLSFDGEEFKLQAASKDEDRPFELCLLIFGFKAGLTISPLSGLNEFLSALVMAKTLIGHLQERDLVAAVVCIEASIPFRPAIQGLSMAETMEKRLRAAEGFLDLSQEEREEAIGRAVHFANEDVKDFALNDPGAFLNNTWKLLPESNTTLRNRGAFTIKEYRTALDKMLRFFLSLDPASIYHSYKDVPDEAEMASLEALAKRNLQYAELYIKAKLLATGILEAISELSGGDAPMALFMGDLPHDGKNQESLLDYLENVAVPSWLDQDNPVHRLLRDGRLDESDFDLKNSPLALYLYHRLKPNEWARISASSIDYFSGACSATDFLSLLPRPLLEDLIKASSAMVPTRKEALIGLVTSIKTKTAS
ncbi:hypothetical protein MASR2M78_08620 [Treponema sp.]